MRILFSLDKYRAREGGADRLAKAVVDVLLAAGHEVRVLEAGGARYEERRDRFSLAVHPLSKPFFFRDGDWLTLCANVAWESILTDDVASFRPDLLLTQNRLAPVSVAVAARAKIPSVLLFHGYRCLSPTFFEGQDALTAPPTTFRTANWRTRLKWPLVAKTLELYDAAYRAATRVVANSDYVAEVIHRFFGREADVLYPVIDLAAELPPAPEADAPSRGKPILFVKPQRIKGAAILIETAKRMPEQTFVVAGAAPSGIERALKRLPNVERRGWVDDMPALYRSSSVLFGPSRIPEPFGRVFVEAGRLGVPSVATLAGGIPEAVGAGGIHVDPNAPASAWVEALRSALEPARYAGLSAAARLHARTLLAAHSGVRLLTILSR